MEQILGFTSKKTSTALELQHPCDLWGKELHLKILCNSRGNLQVQQIYPTWEWGGLSIFQGRKDFHCCWRLEGKEFVLFHFLGAAPQSHCESLFGENPILQSCNFPFFLFINLLQEHLGCWEIIKKIHLSHHNF